MKVLECYALITAAKNEGHDIGRTIESVLAQSTPPVRWVIVDDASTDGTAEVVRSFQSKADWIQLVRKQPSGQRGFASKAAAVETACRMLRGVRYRFIGNLDADVSMGPSYFEALLREFRNHPGMGICGGVVYEVMTGKIIPQNTSGNSVAGAVQFFRRECFEAVGGYKTH